MKVLDSQAEEGVRALLRAIGQDPEREGLRDTPARVLRALKEMTQGYAVDVGALLSVMFTAENFDEVVAVTGIEFSSVCEHHLLPFTGEAAIAYLPRVDKVTKQHRVVGLSKLPRLVDAFAHRLQMQERMAVQIADALDTHLSPRGCAVYLKATHSCAKCRGVRKQGAVMHTSVLRGTCIVDPLRAEVLSLLRVGA